MRNNELETELLNCFNNQEGMDLIEEEDYYYVVVDSLCMCEIYNLSQVVGVTHVVVHPNDESTIQVNIIF